MMTPSAAANKRLAPASFRAATEHNELLKEMIDVTMNEPDSSELSKGNSISTTTTRKGPTMFIASMTRMLLGICLANVIAVACLAVFSSRDGLQMTSIRRGLETVQDGEHNLVRISNEWKPSVFTGSEFEAKTKKPQRICSEAASFFDPQELAESLDKIKRFYSSESDAAEFAKETLFGPKGPTCTNLIKLKTGGSVCLPTVEGSLSEKEECHIIRNGGSDRWEWEQELMANMPPGCQLHKADCTLPRSFNKPEGQFQFYSHCLDHNFHIDSKGRYHVLYSDMLELAELNGPPKYVRLDFIAGGESNDRILRQMTSQDQQVLGMDLQSSLPQQILVDDMVPDMESSKRLFLEGGYVPLAQKPSLKCPTCYQVLFFRVMC